MRYLWICCLLAISMTIGRCGTLPNNVLSVYFAYHLPVAYMPNVGIDAQLSPKWQRSMDVTFVNNLTNKELEVKQLKLTFIDPNGNPVLPTKEMHRVAYLNAHLQMNAQATVQFDPADQGYVLQPGTPYLVTASWEVTSDPWVSTCISLTFPYLYQTAPLPQTVSTMADANGVVARLTVTVSPDAEGALALELQNTTAKTVALPDRPMIEGEVSQHGNRVQPTVVRKTERLATPITLPPGAVITLPLGPIQRLPNDAYELELEENVYQLEPGDYRFAVKMTLWDDGDVPAYQWMLPPFPVTLPAQNLGPVYNINIVHYQAY